VTSCTTGEGAQPGASLQRPHLFCDHDVFRTSHPTAPQQLRPADRGGFGIVCAQSVLEEMEKQAATLSADAVLSVDVDYETVGKNMLMVSVSGTAVKLT
jgi:hypothetical protein